MSDPTRNQRKQQPKAVPTPQAKAQAPTAKPAAPTAPAPGPATPPAKRWNISGYLPRLPTIPVAHAVTLAAIAVLALYLRLKEPLSDSIIGAEDPYLHMARTWDLVQGNGVDNYPIGFMLLLTPLTLLGPDGFYAVARFLPPFLGVLSVVGVFFLCRGYTHPIGALAASVLTAVLPEHIRRTSLLFPTALDLALLPFIVLALLRAIEGVRWGLPTAGALTFLMLVVHPWVVALMAPPLVLFFLIYSVTPATRKWASSMAAGSLGMFLIVLILLEKGGAFSLIFDRVLPQVGPFLASPVPAQMPQFVDLKWMLTIPLLLLALAGAVVAVLRRTKLAVFALIWSVLLFPLVLVDWLGMEFLPHRVVVYLGLGLVILAALPIAELARLLQTSRANGGVPATYGLLGVALILTVPQALAMQPWDNLYDDQDFEAWDALEARGTTYLMAGSWEGRAGYRSLTANEAVYMPRFFEDARERGLQVEDHPDIVVLVDEYTKLPTEFLDSEGWTLVGEWGEKRAYTPPASSSSSE